MGGATRKGPQHMIILRMIKEGLTPWSIISPNQPTPPSPHTNTASRCRKAGATGSWCCLLRDAVDMLSAPELTEAICDALRNAPTGLIVDLTEVNFLASVGMSVLVAAQEAADALSVPFGIVAEGAATSRPIRLLGIDAILVLYPTLGDALRDSRCGNDESAPIQTP